MTGRNSLHYCYDVLYQCWFASEEARIYYNNFNRSNAVVCSYLIPTYNKCGRNGTIWLFFFIFIEECCVVTEKNIDKKLPNRISYQIWYKRCLKGNFGKGVQICEGGSASASGFWPGGCPYSECLSRAGMLKSCRKVKVVLKLWNPYFLTNFLIVLNDLSILV